MKKLFVMGDIHFRADSWWYEVGNKFLQWFSNYDFGPQEDAQFIQLGDITDRDSNPGDVVDMVYRFSEICSKKFSTTWLIVGNHDKKLHKGKIQYSFKFLRNTPNIEIIENHGTIDTYYGKVLVLPFMRIEGQSLEKLYEEGLDPDVYKTEYDLMVGHIAGLEENTRYGGIDLTKFSTKQRALGHIHTRPNNIYGPDYCGSVYPCKINEEYTNLPRCIKIFEKGKRVSEIQLPKFITYKTITYPSKIEETSSDIVNVYSVLECRNLHQARAFYNGFNICSVEKSQKNDTIISSGSAVKVFKSKKEALNDMLKEKGSTIKRPVYKYVTELLDGV